jgi:hypothetical protein
LSGSGNGGIGAAGCPGPWGFGLRVHRNAIDAYRASDILDLLLAHVREHEVELAAHLVAYHPADTDPASFSQSFEARGDVDAVAKDICFLDDDFAYIDADAKLDAPIGGHRNVALGHLALHLDCATHRVDDASELCEDAVACAFHNAAVVLGYLRDDELLEMRL